MQHELPGKQKQAIYTTAIASNDPEESYNIIGDAGYEAYLVDTMISETMVNTADSNQFSGTTGTCSLVSGRIPFSDWIKMTKDQQDAVFAKWNQERMDKSGVI
jgi:hypothetical protein